MREGLGGFKINWRQVCGLKMSCTTPSIQHFFHSFISVLRKDDLKQAISHLVKIFWRCHLPKPRLSQGTLWEEHMWRKSGGRQQDWNSYILLFLTRSCPPIVSEMKSVRCLIMHTPLKYNLLSMLYCLSLSLQFHFHPLRLIFSPLVSSSFSSCQVKAIHPSNLFIPQVAKIFFMWSWIAGPTIPLQNSEN